MLSDDTVHFALSVECEALKAETDSKGKVGALMAKFAGRCGVRSQPDHPGRQRRVRRPRLMGPGVFLCLCDGEVQCGNTTQEIRTSIEMKTGSVSAEVAGERFESITFTGRIYDFELDRELQGHPDSLARIVIFPLAWKERVDGSQFDLRLFRKQYFKGERQRLFLCRLDQRGQDGALFLFGRLKRHNQLRGWCLGLERDRALLCSSMQLENAHCRLDYDIGVLSRDGGKVAGERDAGPPEAEVGNGALPHR